MNANTTPTLKPTEGGFKSHNETREFVPIGKVANTEE